MTSTGGVAGTAGAYGRISGRSALGLAGADRVEPKEVWMITLPRTVARKLLRRLRTGLGAVGRRLAALDVAPAVPGPNERYVEEAPLDRLALEVFSGEWSTRFPPPLEEVSGPHDLFDDPRLDRTLEVLGGVEGRDVLELGPLEGAHTATLRNRHGAGRVVAIEANERAWLRCLTTKEVLGLDRVEFRLGDLRPYLASTTEHFDVAVAIGVLYHLDDPVPVLRDLVRVSDRLVIWTHVYTPEVAGSLNADRFDPPVTRSVDGVDYRLHPFRYEESLEWAGFCGGTRPTASWIDGGDLVEVLEGLGHEIVLRETDTPPLGPTALLATRRRQGLSQR